MDHITKNIYISDQGNAADHDILEDHDIGHVITFYADDHRFTTDHYPLNDGENNQSDFDEAVEVVREAMGQDENVLVHCAAGISRSVTTVATAFAVEQDMSFKDALDRVQENRPQAQPHPDLVDHAQMYLDHS